MSVKSIEEEARVARLFRNGRSQAVRIPREMEFAGDEVRIVRGEEGKLILEPLMKKESLADVLSRLKPLSPEDRFPALDDRDLLPLDDVEL